MHNTNNTDIGTAVIDAEVLAEICDADELSSEIMEEKDIIIDKEVLSVEELLDRIIGAINLLDHIDEYKNAVSKKRREIAYREFDLMHQVEDFAKMQYENPDFKLTAKGCRNFVKAMTKLRSLRRTLKVSDELIFEFQKQSNRLNNEGNRSLLKNDMYKSMKKLTQHHNNRFYNKEQLGKLFDIRLPEGND